MKETVKMAKQPMSEAEEYFKTYGHRFNLFEGDKDGPDRCLRDGIVRAGIEHKHSCHFCGGTIRKGELHRSAVFVYYGLFSARVCRACCFADSSADEDDFALASARMGAYRPAKVRRG